VLGGGEGGGGGGTAGAAPPLEPSMVIKMPENTMMGWMETRQ